MTAPPLAPPVSASEAIALADIIARITDGRPLRDDVRAQFCAHLAGEHFDNLVPLPGSLAQDPGHSAACYLAVDALGDGEASPLLLLIAPAAARPSVLFPNAFLIGCSRPGDGRELAVRAVPFSHLDHGPIRTFAGDVDTAFLPRPHGVQPVLTVASDEPAVALPAAMQAYRQVLRSCGHNVASVVSTGGDPDRLLDAALWSVIRAGWREGFSAGLRVPLAGGLQAAKQAIRRGQHYSRFILSAGRGDFEELDICVQLHAFITEIKSGHRPWKHFDMELSLTGSGVSAPDDVAFCLEWLKRHGCPAQSVAPDLAGIFKVPELESCVSDLAEAVLPFNATLTIHQRAYHSPASIERIVRAASGRLNYEMILRAGMDPREIIETIEDIAACLRG